MNRRNLQLLGTTLAWGALWGPVLGIWAIVPHFLRTNHVHPVGLEQWSLLAALAVGTFALLGVAGSLVVWLLLASWQGLRGHGLRAPGWGSAFAVLLSLPALYLLLAATVELTVFRSLVGLEGYEQFLVPAAASYAVITALIGLGYRALSRMTNPPPVRVLAVSGLAALAAGLALAPLWGGAVRVGDAEVFPLTVAQPSSQSSSSPLLFVGIDSATWRVVAPAIESGRAPTFRRLIENGIRGEVLASAAPVWSGPAWAAIVTGQPRHENGVYQELAAVIPGLPPFQVPLGFDFLLDPLLLVEYRLATAGYVRIVPLPRSTLRRPPFWERLWAADVAVGVIRFPFTFPADDRGAVVVSDYAGEDVWKLLEVQAHGGPGVISPENMKPELLAAFTRPSPRAEQMQSWLLPDGVPPGASGSMIPPEDTLRIAVQIDQRTLDVAEDLLRSDLELPVFAVFLGGFDAVCHAFWKYRFPEDFAEDPPDAESVRELGHVIDRYLEFLDRGLERLIAAYPEPPNVVVTADHGHGPLYKNRIYNGGHSVRDGVFVAAGPGVPSRGELLEVTWFDVIPTVFELLGFAKPEDLPGYSLLSPDARIRQKPLLTSASASP